MKSIKDVRYSFVLWHSHTVTVSVDVVSIDVVSVDVVRF